MYFHATFLSILLRFVSLHDQLAATADSGKTVLTTGNLLRPLSSILLLIDATVAVLEALVTLLLASSMLKVCESSLQQEQPIRFESWRTWVS